MQMSRLILVSLLTVQVGCAWTVGTREIEREVFLRQSGEVRMESRTTSETRERSYGTRTHSRTTYDCFQDSYTRYKVTKERYYKNMGTSYFVTGLVSALVGGLFLAKDSGEQSGEAEVYGWLFLAAGGLGVGGGLLSWMIPEPTEEIIPATVVEFENTSQREYVSCQ